MDLQITAPRLNLLDRAQQLNWAIAARDRKDFYSCKDQAKFILQGSRATKTPEVVDFINLIFSQDIFQQGLERWQNINEFVNSMPTWIANHQGNNISGLDRFQIDFSAGTTQSFDSFYYRHRTRRMRCFVGEYFYHLKTWISNSTNWSMVSESDPLVAGDALVISLPFCDTGTQLENFEQVLTLCDQLNIPVLIDCCYYPISNGICADFSADCIDTVAFSLSKAFPIARLRIGVRFTKSGIFDGQRLHDSIHYNNSLSAWIGLKIIQKFSSDYIYNIYHQQQLEVCDYFELTPSQSVLFAIGDSSWDRYNRNNLLQTYQLNLDVNQFQNRICLSAIYDNWDLFKSIKHETAS